jgi:hypothetical protein
MVDPPRPPAQRKADSLALLAAPAADVWVATASADGVAHLVPLSLAWDGDRVILALERTSVTGRNLEASRRARLGVGPTRDVVLLDAVVTSIVAVDDAPGSIADLYAAQADWDPRGAGDPYVYVVLAPERIQAWREANEIAGRTLLRGGSWLV